MNHPFDLVLLHLVQFFIKIIQDQINAFPSLTITSNVTRIMSKQHSC